MIFDKEDDDSAEDAINEGYVDFNPSTTILFSSDYAKQRLKLDKHSIIVLREKIQQDCLRFVNLAYTDFIVNYGCNYGIIALSEILYIKNIYNLDINLYYGKVMYEHATCITQLDSVEVMRICHFYGVKHIGILPPGEFIQKVICKVSRISTEHGVLKTDRKLPNSMYEHYKKIEQELHDSVR